MPKFTSVEVTTSTSVMEILGVTVSMVAAMAMGTGLLAGMLFTKSSSTLTNTASPNAFTLFALEQSASPLTIAEIQKNVSGLETVFVRANAYTLKVLNQSGADVFTPIPVGGAVLHTPAVGDIDGDGEMEILIAPQISSKILAFNHDGTPVAGWPITIDQGTPKSLQLADVNGDSVLDLVYITKNIVHMVSGNGQEIRSFSTADGMTGTTTASGLEIQDVNNDNQLEVVTTTSASTVPYDTLHTAVYSLTGTKLTAWNSDGQTNTLLVADVLRSTPEKEIIVYASLFNKLTSETTYKIYGFTSTGNPLLGWPIQGNHGQIILGNVTQQLQNGKDNLEIVSTIGSQIVVYQADGTIANGWPITPSSTCTPDYLLLNDVTGDLSPEIFATTKSTTLSNCPVLFLDANGQHVLNSPISINASFTGYRAPAIGDIDADGKPEILAPAQNTSYIIRMESETAAATRSAQWPQLKQSPTLRPTIPVLCLPTAIGSTADPACIGMCTDGSPNHACNGAASCVDGALLVNGDADNSGQVNITDAVYLINYIFAGGAAPSPMSLGDADGTGQLNITDAVYLINYIFAGGPAPKCPPGSAAVKRAVDPTEGMTYEQFKAQYPQAFTATEQVTEQL